MSAKAESDTPTPVEGTQGVELATETPSVETGDDLSEIRTAILMIEESAYRLLQTADTMRSIYGIV